MNPNQIRSYGIYMWNNLSDKDRGLCVSVNYKLTITVKMEGTNIFFRWITPTDDKLNNFL